MNNSSPIQVTPMILCGGSGTSLWPLLRVGFPKQFLILSYTASFFQQAVDCVNCITSNFICLLETLAFVGIQKLRGPSPGILSWQSDFTKYRGIFSGRG